MQIAPQIQQLIAQVAAAKESTTYLRARDGESVITVDHIASQLSHLYEKMRYSVDYKEEHLLRRNALERILKRRLLEGFRRGSIARFFVTELVRAGYLPNNTLPERIIDDVDGIIHKALLLYKAQGGGGDEILGTSPQFNRIVSMVATEIELLLFPSIGAHTTANAFYLTVRDLITVKDADDLPLEAQHTQTYIACYRSLLGYDEAGLFYRLWVLYHPQWEGTTISEEEIMELGTAFAAYEEELTGQLAHPLNWRLMPKLRDYGIYFALIKESIEKKSSLWTQETLDITAIKKHISTLLTQKYASEKRLISRSASRAIIYILLTKITLAFLVELPYDLATVGVVNKLALGVNVVFHPLLLFVVTRVVRLPKGDSKYQTTTSIAAIIEDKSLPQISVWLRRRQSLFGAILTLIYLFFFTIIFGGIVWILRTLDFNIVSGALFLLFLTLVSYFGLRIRNRAKKWRVTPKDTSAKSFFIDLMTLPIIQAGQWITKKFDSVNIFVFVMDFLIETPFKMLVEIFEGFTNYLREKKEELE